MPFENPIRAALGAAAVVALLGAPAQAQPVGTIVDHSCDGARPGGVVTIDDALCTFNFVWRGTWTEGLETRSADFIGTAGHCVLCDVFPCSGDIDNGEHAFAFGAGPVARDGAGNVVGRVVYAIQSGDSDVALIRVDPGASVNPGMCHFGGPNGQNDDLSTEPVLLHHRGNGPPFDLTVPARTSISLGLTDPDVIHAIGLSIFGDSGAGVISEDGRAVGILVAGGVAFGGLSIDGANVASNSGNVFITRLAPQISGAETFVRSELGLSGFGLELLTADF